MQKCKTLCAIGHDFPKIEKYIYIHYLPMLFEELILIENERYLTDNVFLK